MTTRRSGQRQIGQAWATTPAGTWTGGRWASTRRRTFRMCEKPAPRRHRPAHPMHVVAVGRASSRPSGIGSPHFVQVP